MPAPQPVSLCTAMRVGAALDALRVNAVSRPDGWVDLVVWDTNIVRGRVRRTELQGWLEARVELVECESCDKDLGEPGWVEGENHPVACHECLGEGCYVVAREGADVDLDVLADNAADQATDVLRDRVAP